MNTLAFDIETVPDVELGRRLYDLGGFDDATVAHVMTFKQRQDEGQRRAAAASAARRRDLVRDAQLRRRARVQPRRRAIAASASSCSASSTASSATAPTLVSWNGSGFDLPVLNYRALAHGLSAARYWEVGDGDRDFRYNNYLARFHWRHVDLMDVLSAYGASGRASLDQVAQLLRLPGKLGMSGADVWPRVPARRDRCDPQLLRDRRAEHVSDLPALPGPARRASTRSSTLTRCSSVEAKLEQSERSAPARVPRGLARGTRCGLTAPR